MAAHLSASSDRSANNTYSREAGAASMEVDA